MLLLLAAAITQAAAATTADYAHAATVNRNTMQIFLQL